MEDIIDIIVTETTNTIEITAQPNDEIIDVNLKAVFHCAQLVYPEMKKRGGGKIILIGSLTSVQGLGVAPVYSATKGAVESQFVMEKN
jgi:short-subunit dehydrogenase